MSSIVSKYTISGVTVNVEEVDSLMDNGTILYGIYTAHNSKILLARTASGETISNDKRLVSMYHEILHSFFDIAALGFKPAEEEELVERLAYVLLQFDKTKEFFKKSDGSTLSKVKDSVGFKQSYKTTDETDD